MPIGSAYLSFLGNMFIHLKRNIDTSDDVLFWYWGFPVMEKTTHFSKIIAINRITILFNRLNRENRIYNSNW